MTIKWDNKNADLHVRLIGRLDSTTAEDLEKALIPELNSNISSLTVNLEQVDYISSKGLRVLVGAYKALNGRDIILKGANSSVTELLRLSGLLKIFKIA